MATYYVDFVNGSDANNGLGPDASAVSNKPWKTIGKLLGASGMASGDTAYLSPAGPFREQVTVAMTSATGTTQIIADPLNGQGFKTSGGVLVSPGEVIWTAFDVSDTAIPTGTAATLTLAGRDFLTFVGITFVGGKNTTAACVNATTTHSTDITFTDCTFLPGTLAAAVPLIAYTGVAGSAANWTIDRCRGLQVLNAAAIQFAIQQHTSETNVNITVQNCYIESLNGSGILATSNGASTNLPNGITIQNNTIKASGRCIGIYTAATTIDLVTPCKVYNNLLMGGNTAGIGAGKTSQVDQKSNLIHCGTALASVNTDASSTTDGSKAILVNFGQGLYNGRITRTCMTPLSGSPLLGFGNSGSPPSVDALNRTRPSGGASTSNAVGCYERHDIAAQETTTVDAGSSGVKITGPGDHDLQIPVDATSTTITVRARYDTNHNTTNKPQAQILANGTIGVTLQTATMTVGIDTWETLTFTFTPSAKGFVTLRLVSRAAAGNGIAFFDTVTGGASGSQGLDYFRGGEPLAAAVQSSGGGSSPIIRPGMVGGLWG